MRTQITDNTRTGVRHTYPAEKNRQRFTGARDAPTQLPKRNRSRDSQQLRRRHKTIRPGVLAEAQYYACLERAAGSETLQEQPTRRMYRAHMMISINRPLRCASGKLEDRVELDMSTPIKQSNFHGRSHSFPVRAPDAAVSYTHLTLPTKA